MTARQKSENIIGYTFITPAVVLFIVFMLLPIVMTLGLSFTNYNGYTFEGLKFVGLRNFEYLFSNDEYFLGSLKNMSIYMLIIPINIAISLGIALLISKPTKTNNVFRVLYYIPVLTSAIATATVWKYMLDPNIGLINEFLKMFNISPIVLYDKSTAKLAVMIVTIWMGIGGNMVLYIAALKGIPEHLYEAAAVEGANRRQTFFYITLPLLRPVTYFVLTMLLISVPQIFDQVLVLTGLNSISVDTQTPVYMIFNNINETGGSAALAVAEASILFIIIMVITAVTQAFKKERY